MGGGCVFSGRSSRDRSGSRSGGSGDLVEHSLVKCARHARQRELGREGKVRVCCRCWVGQARRREANEVVASVGAHRGVHGKRDAGGGGDIDRAREHNRLQESLFMVKKNGQFGSGCRQENSREFRGFV